MNMTVALFFRGVWGELFVGDSQALPAEFSHFLIRNFLGKKFPPAAGKIHGWEARNNNATYANYE
jgi:hypothetical protein